MNSIFLWIVAILLVVGLFGLWACMIQVIRQQGRILLRLDELDKTQNPDAPQGLPPGSAMTAFELEDMEGRSISLENYRGWKIILVHWSPSCGFCGLLAEKIQEFQQPLRTANVQILLVAREDQETNRKFAADHGLTCPILMGDDNLPPLIDAFTGTGTPTAYLLDEQGFISRNMVVGADLVIGLLEELLSEPIGRKRLPGELPLAKSRLAREGLPAGTVAPNFELAELLHEKNVTLSDYHGHPVVVLFTDLKCGPCLELAPRLAQLQAVHGDQFPVLMVVMRGDEAGCRTKAPLFGPTARVLHQPQFEVSKKFQIFEVPVAFLVDEQGIISRSVARGADQILELVKSSFSVTKT